MSGHLEGDEALIRRLDAVGKVGIPMMRTLGLKAVGYQKKLVPVKTGNLRRSIHLASVSRNEAVTEASESYGAAVEFGSRQHVVVPVRRKVLRFPAKGVPVTLGGRVRTGSARALGSAAFVFAKKVTIPAQPPRPFMVPGARKAIQESGIAGIIIKAWNQAA